MRVEQFDKFVSTKVKNPQQIIEQMTPEKVYELSASIHWSVLAGQYLDNTKKFAVYNKDYQPHQEPAASELNPTSVIDQLTPEKVDLLHMGIGVSGESAELLDAIQQHALFNKPLDRENVIEELGDLEFFVSRIYSSLGITREQVREHCFNKLNKRYKGGYTDAEAALRADKVDEQAPQQLSLPVTEDRWLGVS